MDDFLCFRFFSLFQILPLGKLLSLAQKLPGQCGSSRIQGTDSVRDTIEQQMIQLRIQLFFFHHCLILYHSYGFILLYPICQYFIRIYRTIATVMKLNPLKEKISITIDVDVLAKARYLAEQDDHSLSQFINLALREYIREFPHPNQTEKS